jgi:predicted RNA-binding protein (virulence factor B family)
MFVRIKKQKAKNHTLLIFQLCENQRVKGKVKQRVLKYLASVKTNLKYNHNPKFNDIVSRYHLWKDVFKKTESLDESLKDMVNKSIEKRIPVPTDEEIAWLNQYLKESSESLRRLLSGENA